MKIRRSKMLKLQKTIRGMKVFERNHAGYKEILVTSEKMVWVKRK